MTSARPPLDPPSPAHPPGPSADPPRPTDPPRTSAPPARATALFVGTAALLGTFQLYTAGVRPVDLFLQRGLHLGLIEVLAFLLVPARSVGSPGLRGWLARVADALLIAGALLAPAYLVGNLDAIVDRAGAWTTVDLVAGVVAVVTLLEASRRTLGLAITLVGTGAVAYAYAGPWLPGLLQHGGYGTGRIVGQLFLGQEGIYGIPLGVAATFVFIFILFGGLLEVTGAGRFFIDLAYALTGRRRGGPAKAAVLASAALGSVSGSAIANVVTSGSFTIPLMKRVGYRAEEAGGIEAAASTGGQVLPPIMGAGAFLIAEYTGFAYVEVVKAALIPALLYIATIYVFVHLVAARRGIEGLPASQLPSFSRVLASGWHYLLAIAVLVGALLLDLSVTRVGFLACVAVALLAAARAVWDRWRAAGAARARTPRRVEARAAASQLLAAFVIASRNAVPVSLACAVAGIIVGVVGLTGLGLKFSAIMLALSQGNLLLALGLILLASLVLGMGLPVTASYVVLIVLAGPALISDFGLPVLVAHLVVFWYSQDSNVTPPVCLAAYAAAGIAGSDPMRTGLHAWKYAKGLYLIPLFMVVHPEIVLGGPAVLVAVKAAAAMAGLAAFAAALEGYLAGRAGWGARIALLVPLGLAFHPSAWVAAGAIPMLGGVALWTRRGSAGAARVAGP